MKLMSLSILDSITEIEDGPSGIVSDWRQLCSPTQSFNWGIYIFLLPFTKINNHPKLSHLLKRYIFGCDALVSINIPDWSLLLRKCILYIQNIAINSRPTVCYFQWSYVFLNESLLEDCLHSERFWITPRNLSRRTRIKVLKSSIISHLLLTKRERIAFSLTFLYL